ncbi:MAG TPA: hypothetical protein VET65_00880 [Candidatus Limnocylindrales bacterium]|nr:hypothetical protein [Candidatus Limnocylindrales bacterium]
MPDSNDLAQLSDDALSRRVRELMAEMSPLEEALGRLRAQIQQVASEQRRRERQQHLATRMQVRTTVAQGQMPTLQQVAESLEELIPSGSALTGLRFYRDSGTEVGLGYATGREPTLWMTNGAETATVRSIAELRARYADGWDFGTSAHPGVRIHLPNTRTEKILTPAEVFVRSREA